MKKNIFHLVLFTMLIIWGKTVLYAGDTGHVRIDCASGVLLVFDNKSIETKSTEEGGTFILDVLPKRYQVRVQDKMVHDAELIIDVVVVKDKVTNVKLGGFPQIQIVQQPVDASLREKVKAKDAAKKAQLDDIAAKKKERTAKILKNLEENLILVKAGTFMMGSPLNEKDRKTNETQHSVTLTNDYYIGKYEVTGTEWETLMTGSQYSSDYPIKGVTWDECNEFLQKLNQLTGKGFRFPTEAEWEYAARDGNKSEGYIYSGSNNIDEVAMYNKNSGGRNYQAAIVGSKKPNELGIYDMSGNVAEWCQDGYGSYPQESVTNPTGSNTQIRVFRGGFTMSQAGECRVSFRAFFDKTGKNGPHGGIGLRLCLPADSKNKK